MVPILNTAACARTWGAQPQYRQPDRPCRSLGSDGCGHLSLDESVGRSARLAQGEQRPALVSLEKPGSRSSLQKNFHSGLKCLQIALSRAMELGGHGRKRQRTGQQLPQPVALSDDWLRPLISAAQLETSAGSRSTCAARSTQGLASSRSKITCASAKSGSSSAARSWRASHSPCSSSVTASQKGKLYSRKPPAAVLKRASSSFIRARKRYACASRKGGRSPGGSSSIVASSSSARAFSPSTSAEATAQTRPCLTPCWPAPRLVVYLAPSTPASNASR